MVNSYTNAEKRVFDMENKKTKILMIEDSPDDALLIKRNLEGSTTSGFLVTAYNTLHEGLDNLANENPDLVISDLGLPDSQGLDTVKKILTKAPQIPLVVLSGVDDESLAIKAVQAGAQDYLVKGRFESSQLERSLNYSIERARLQAELEKHNREITGFHKNLHKILQKNTDAILVISEDKRILFNNPAAESLLGSHQIDLLEPVFDYDFSTGKTLEIEIPQEYGTDRTAETSAVDIEWEGNPAILVTMHDITERKQMETAVKDSEEKFSAAFRSSPDMMVIVNLDKDVCIEVNDSFTQATGYTREEIIGHNIRKYDIWAYPEEEKKLMKLLHDKGAVKNEECSFRMKSGEIRRWLCSAEVFNIGGATCNMLTARDITERKQMEEAIKESQEKFYKAFHTNANSFSISRADNGNFIEVNDSFTRFTGFTREEAIGHNAYDLNMWSSENESAEVIALIRKNEKLQNSYVKVRCKSGEMKDGLLSFEQLVINGVKCLITTITDISELKRAEESLRESEEKFYITFQRSPEMILITRLDDGTVVEANETFIRLSGHTREEAIGKNVIELEFWADPQDRSKMAEYIKDKKIVSNREYRFRMKSGEIRTCLYSGEIINIRGQLHILSVIIDISERKKIEDALRFSDTALKSIHEGVYAMDNEFRVTHWNEMCEQMFGIKASDAIGKPMSEVLTVTEEYPGQNEKRFKVLLEKGFNKEEQHYHTPHGNIWVDVQAQAIVENGERHGWITLVSDISERKKIEEALRFSDAAFKSIHDSVIATDTNHIVSYWNKTSEEIYGIKASEAIGKDLMELVDIIEEHPGDIERINQKMNIEGYCRLEQRHRSRKGEVWVDVTVQAIEEKGERFGWVILASEITQRKLADEALKQSEEKYRGLINTSIDAIISTDQQMSVTIWNNGAEKLFGYTEKEMLGQSIMAIFPETVQADTARELIQIKKTGTTKAARNVFETYVMKKDCSLVPVDVSLSTRKTENNVVITAILRDITVRKEAEEKLRQIDQMKSEFLSNVSHELRTPLQSISGFTHLIMTGQVPDQETQKEFLQIIDRETIHLGNLINSLLDMSRLEAGRFQIYRKPVAIRETIIDSLKMFKSLAHQKNIELTEIIPENLPEMEVDNERIRQVIINLVSNAIKFSEPGTKVRVSAEINNSELLFQVADQGTGIREENIKNLFQRFYREEGEKVRGGTGLGLYISRQIVEAHGGRIWAESKFGEGSTFSFSLPLNSEGGKKDG